MCNSWAALAAEEDPQGRGIKTLLVEAGAGGGGEGRGGGGVQQREQWEDPLATQPKREIELSQTNRGAGGVCVDLYPVSNQSSPAPFTRTMGKSSCKMSKPWKVRQ